MRGQAFFCPSSTDAVSLEFCACCVRFQPVTALEEEVYGIVWRMAATYAKAGPAWYAIGESRYPILTNNYIYLPAN